MAYGPTWMHSLARVFCGVEMKTGIAILNENKMKICFFSLRQ